MFETPRRGRQARNFTTNAPKILGLKSSSEQIFSRKLPLGVPALDELWNGFDSDADLSMYRTRWISYYDVFCKQFDRNEYLSPLEFNTARIKIGV